MTTRRQRGFALLIVLWLLVPLSVLFLVLSGTARSDAQLTANLRDAAAMEEAADGAINTAIFALLERGAAAPFVLHLPEADSCARC
jgi:general secretion pathway protein K